MTNKLTLLALKHLPQNFLDAPEHSAFAGWPKQLHIELFSLIGQRGDEWIAAVSKQIEEALTDPDYVIHGLEGTPNLARTEEMALTVLFGDPGKVGQFAGIEPHYPWNACTPATQRWERYAVFSWMQLECCIVQLETLPHLEDNAALLRFSYSVAGGFALDAMRTLQIAVSLKADERDKSARGRNAAKARHDAMKPKREEALRMANSQAFRTKEAALDHITQNLTIDAAGKKFISRRAVSEWLRDAGWKAKGK